MRTMSLKKALACGVLTPELAEKWIGKIPKGMTALEAARRDERRDTIFDLVLLSVVLDLAACIKIGCSTAGTKYEPYAPWILVIPVFAWFVPMLLMGFFWKKSNIHYELVSDAESFYSLFRGLYHQHFEDRAWRILTKRAYTIIEWEKQMEYKCCMEEKVQIALEWKKDKQEYESAVAVLARFGIEFEKKAVFDAARTYGIQSHMAPMPEKK